MASVAGSLSASVRRILARILWLVLAALSWTPVAEARELIVMEGDTLWRLANANLPPGETDAQAYMDAIMRANPHAFLQGDSHRMAICARLTLPGHADPEETASADRCDTAPEVLRQPDARQQVDLETNSVISTPAAVQTGLVARNGELDAVRQALADASLALADLQTSSAAQTVTWKRRLGEAESATAGLRQRLVWWQGGALAAALLALGFAVVWWRQRALVATGSAGNPPPPDARADTGEQAGTTESGDEGAIDAAVKLRLAQAQIGLERFAEARDLLDEVIDQGDATARDAALELRRTLPPESAPDATRDPAA